MASSLVLVVSFWMMLCETAAVAPAKSKPARHRQMQAQTENSININRASLEEIKRLPGIGHATAHRIVEYRTKNPPFRRVEELLIIRGISRQRLERIRGRIRVD